MKKYLEERLFFYVRDSQVYRFYFGDFELDRKYTSPLRLSDPNPSFKIWEYKGKLYWKDFGLDGNYVPDSVGFVQALLSLNEGRDVQRVEAVDRAFKDLVVEKNAPPALNLAGSTIRLPYELDYDDLYDDELVYWSRYFLTRRDLDGGNIKAVRGLYRNGKRIFRSVPKDPAYAYITDDRDVFKVYRPLTTKKQFKFLGQNNGGILEGYETLPSSGKTLLINSSYKDTLVMRKIGYMGVNPTSENSFHTLLKYASELNFRFNEVKVFFDSDDAGVKAANFLKKEVGWDTIYLPYAKDPSDFVELCGSYYHLITFMERLYKF